MTSGTGSVWQKCTTSRQHQGQSLIPIIALYIHLFSLGQLRVNEFTIQYARAVGCRGQQPQHKYYLQFVVKRKPATPANVTRLQHSKWQVSTDASCPNDHWTQSWTPSAINSLRSLSTLDHTCHVCHWRRVLSKVHELQVLLQEK